MLNRRTRRAPAAVPRPSRVAASTAPTSGETAVVSASKAVAHHDGFDFDLTPKPRRAPVFQGSVRSPPMFDGGSCPPQDRDSRPRFPRQRRKAHPRGSQRAGSSGPRAADPVIPVVSLEGAAPSVQGGDNLSKAVYRIWVFIWIFRMGQQRRENRLPENL